jgi:hypothetical protein
MKRTGMRSGDIVPRFLSSALDEGEWSASRSSCLIPREAAPGTHVYESALAPESIWAFLGRKNVLPLPGIELRFIRHPVRSLISILPA